MRCRVAEYDLPDVYCGIHGYTMGDPNRFLTADNRQAIRSRLRAARALNAVTREYVHRVRERRLTDHSAVEVTFSTRAKLDRSLWTIVGVIESTRRIA